MTRVEKMRKERDRLMKSDEVCAVEKIISSRERFSRMDRHHMLRNVATAYQKRGPLTSREVAEVTNYSHKQIKRWVVAFLPPDPVIKQYSGVPRRHTLEGICRAVTGGILISSYGATIREAKIKLDECWAILAAGLV
jgi:hypothetical protein